VSESENCPKCESKLSPRLSTGRVVCTNCGWSDRPRSVEPDGWDDPKLGVANGVLTNIKGALSNALDGAIEGEVQRREREERRNELARKNKKPFTHGLGSSFLILGLLMMLGGLFYDTSVESSSEYSSGRIINNGRVSDRANITNFGGFLSVCGSIFICASSLKKAE
jgi:hypothetical protein